jgi:hypothetical protein
MGKGKPAQSVDDVQQLLRHCIDVACAENSPLGYFPVLHLAATRELLHAAANGVFEQPVRLRQTIVVLANRYLVARERFRAGKPTTKTWALAFNASRSPSLVASQHLLLALSAQLNLDLGIAISETGLLGEDYERVVDIVSVGVERLRSKLTRTSFLMKTVGGCHCSFDEQFAVFSMKAARKNAMLIALGLQDLSEDELIAATREVDEDAALLGRRILRPGFTAQVLLAAARMTEQTQSPRQLIQLLAR